MDLTERAPSLDDASKLDRLIAALEHTIVVLRTGSDDEGSAALTHALAVLGELYGTLDSTTQTETAAHLTAACDACLLGLGEAYGGNYGMLFAASAHVRWIRSALLPRVAAASQALRVA